MAGSSPTSDESFYGDSQPDDMDVVEASRMAGLLDKQNATLLKQRAAEHEVAEAATAQAQARSALAAALAELSQADAI